VCVKSRKSGNSVNKASRVNLNAVTCVLFFYNESCNIYSTTHFCIRNSQVPVGARSPSAVHLAFASLPTVLVFKRAGHQSVTMCSRNAKAVSRMRNSQPHRIVIRVSCTTSRKRRLSWHSQSPLAVHCPTRRPSHRSAPRARLPPAFQLAEPNTPQSALSRCTLLLYRPPRTCCGPSSRPCPLCQHAHLCSSLLLFLSSPPSSLCLSSRMCPVGACGGSLAGRLLRGRSSARPAHAGGTWGKGARGTARRSHRRNWHGNTA
jgi:hypothetical protein